MAAAAPAKTKSGRRNPTAVERAADISREFHGREIRWQRDVEEQYVFRPVHALLGKLEALWIDAGGGKAFPVRFNRKTWLAVTTDRRSLYCLGGEQELDVSALGLPAEAVKDRMVIGTVVRVEYYTRKDFHNFEPTVYVHDFGVKDRDHEGLLEPWQEALVDERGNAPKPVLIYDVLNERFELAGGAYFVRREGIVL
jgi:hypothetical protein